jgi:hypothetical protein
MRNAAFAASAAAAVAAPCAASSKQQQLRRGDIGGTDPSPARAAALANAGRVLTAAAKLSSSSSNPTFSNAAFETFR